MPLYNYIQNNIELISQNQYKTHFYKSKDKKQQNNQCCFIFMDIQIVIIIIL